MNALSIIQATVEPPSWDHEVIAAALAKHLNWLLHLPYRFSLSQDSLVVRPFGNSSTELTVFKHEPKITLTGWDSRLERFAPVASISNVTMAMLPRITSAVKAVMNISSMEPYRLRDARVKLEAAGMTKDPEFSTNIMRIFK